MCLIIMYVYYAHFNAKLSLNIRMKKHILHNFDFRGDIFVCINYTVKPV
jgi:hypothetical protein